MESGEGLTNSLDCLSIGNVTSEILTILRVICEYATIVFLCRKSISMKRARIIMN